MARLHEIPATEYTPPIPPEEAEAIRLREIEEAEMRAAEVFLDDLGRELCDPTPMQPPLGYNPQPSLAEQMRMMIQSERLRLEAEAAGYETFEEADDFEMDEDPFPRSQHEDEFDSPLSARELRRREREAQAAASSPPKPPTEKSAGDQPATGTEAAQQPKSGAEGPRSKTEA